MRALARRFGFRFLGCVQQEMSREDLGRSAIVFAPHPDDETLGCGGTIIRKKRAGAAVRIVYMTDGSQSHARLMAPADMKALRAGEAVAAAQALGVGREDVVLLEFPDGQLSQHREAGVRRVGEVLQATRPDEVFIPYYQDGPPDHLATTHIVEAALRACRPEATVFEYPIWFWYHWPWTRLESRGRGLLRDLKQSTARNWSLLRDFRCFVRIRPVLDLKRAALAQHRSQAARYLPDPSWLTLGDIAGGDFLECFFQEREIFYRHRPGQRG
jgi:LmbE family N-acetylglucosaminyl deacetylase